MSAQRYASPVAQERMARGTCPECGDSALAHSNDPRFWMPRSCDLTAQGVVDRINQHAADLSEGVDQ